jgi:hypothetical protein
MLRPVDEAGRSLLAALDEQFQLHLEGAERLVDGSLDH